LKKEIEDETDKSSQVLKQNLETFTKTFKESELGKKTVDLTGELAKQAKQTAETLSKQTQEISQTAAFKKVSEVRFFLDIFLFFHKSNFF
jgi:import inner membrane translocase subunit TIM44